MFDLHWREKEIIQDILVKKELMHKRGEMKSYYKGRTKKFIDYVLGTEGVVSLMIESNKMCDPCS